MISLIAIMLGRLRMTVDECIEAYSSLMEKVFEKRENRTYVAILRRERPRFSSKALEDAIKSVLISRNVPVDEKFEDPNEAEGDDQGCKVYVPSLLMDYDVAIAHDLHVLTT